MLFVSITHHMCDTSQQWENGRFQLRQSSKKSAVPNKTEKDSVIITGDG